jgi:hypothetical protein
MACSRSSSMTGARHGETSTGRHGFGRAGTCAGNRGSKPGRSALCAGGIAAGSSRCDARANGRCPGRRTRDGGQVPVATAHSGSAALATGAGLGRPSSGGDERRRGTQLSAAVGQALCRRRHARRIAATRSAGAASVVYRLLARHGWRKVAPDTRHPKSDPIAQEEWKKNSPKRWQPC